MKKVIIVDENDKVIGYKDSDKITSSDLYRVSSLWIQNSKGETLFARRAYSKSHDPGKWGSAVDGTVEKGETYYLNIIKEAEEELGLKDIKPTKAYKERLYGKWNYFCQWYFLKLNKKIDEFEINEREIAEIRWFSRGALIDELKKPSDEFVGTVEERIKIFDKFQKFVSK